MNTKIMKSGKGKKIIKYVAVSSIILCVLGILTCFCIFHSITKEKTLNHGNLTSNIKNTAFSSFDGNQISSISSEVKLNSLQPYTINAFIAKEDKRFYKHKGNDLIRIFGALKNNILSSGIVEGGSTISQQLIKNTHTNSERTIERKLTEIKLATELENNYTKDDILEMYLNTIYFGNNCYGIQSASMLYFNKSADELSLAESALLAGIISAPSSFNPIVNLDVAIKKGKLVLSLMQQQEFISEDEKVLASRELDNIEINKASTNFSNYMSYAIKEACAILGVNEIPSDKKIIISTYLNEELQAKAEDMITSRKYVVKNKNNIEPDISTIVIDNDTGGIIALAGNSKFNLMELRRQPASTIKPILVYGPAIEYNNYVPCSLILDEPINIEGYTPHNATKLYYGYTSLRDNVVRSTNIPAVKLLNEVGLSKAKQFAENSGIVFSENDNNLAIALGGFTDGITISELAGSYVTIARGGSFVKPTFVKSITIDDKIVYENSGQSNQVMSEETAYILTDMLKSVANYGTGRKIKNVGDFIASKTGTNATNESNMDAWNASFTTEHTAVCWIGNTTGLDGSMHDTIKGSTYPTLFVKELYEHLYKNNTPSDFEMPSNLIYVDIDKNEYNENHQIFLADDTSTKTLSEMFNINNLPQPKPTPQIDTKKAEIVDFVNNSDSLFKVRFY